MSRGALEIRWTPAKWSSEMVPPVPLMCASLIDWFTAKAIAAAIRCFDVCVCVWPTIGGGCPCSFIGRILTFRRKELEYFTDFREIKPEVLSLNL
jgi:hypothetical protein